MARRHSEKDPLLAEVRRQAIVEHVAAHGAITVSEVASRFGVSAITGRRDLSELDSRGLVRRSHGGAVRPASRVREDAFARRLATHVAEKRALADAVVATLPENPTAFLDSSTTSYFLARRIAQLKLPATLLTNSLAIATLLFEQTRPPVEVVLVGGSLRRVNRSFVGPSAIQTVRNHFPELFFFSVKAATPDGMLTEADPLEAEVKRAMMDQAGTTTLLLDRSKLATRGLVAIAPIESVGRVQAVGLSAAQLSDLRSLGARVDAVPLPASTDGLTPQ